MDEETYDHEQTEGVRKSARPITTVLLAEVLLRVLEKLSDADSDQEFVDIYNEFKPTAEAVLRSGTSNRMTRTIGHGFSKDL